MVDLYFLTVNYNSSSLVARLIESLPKNSDDKYRLVIVNNSPEDKNIFELENKRIKIIAAEQNLGFGRACNLGLEWVYRQNSQAIVWLINPDAYFNSDTVETEISPTSWVIAFFQNHPQISILGTTVYNSESQITAAGGTFTPGTAALAVVDSLPEIKQDYFKTNWVSGCSLLINLANFDRCPHFDPRYFLYYEDLDFCLRYGQQGHQIAITPLLKVFHDTSSISDRNLLQKYRHITKSYLIHIEKYGSLTTFIWTNIRLYSNTVRLLLFRPKQGLGKLIGIYEYWRTRLLL